MTLVTRYKPNSKLTFNLSDREVQILNEAANGYSNKEIAERLYLSADTIDTHNRNLTSKMNARNMKHAIAIALRNKLIQ